MNIIEIKNQLTSKSKIIKLHNHFCCPVLSPDSKYAAILEYQPFAFNDGKTFLLEFINLNTGKMYSISDTLVSMPDSMFWSAES